MLQISVSSYDEFFRHLGLFSYWVLTRILGEYFPESWRVFSEVSSIFSDANSIVNVQILDKISVGIFFFKSKAFASKRIG